MEISKQEIELAQIAIRDAQERALNELAEFDLVMVGGGCGNDIFG